jgi:hypothetical protein
MKLIQLKQLIEATSLSIDLYNDEVFFTGILDDMPMNENVHSPRVNTADAYLASMRHLTVKLEFTTMHHDDVDRFVDRHWTELDAIVLNLRINMFSVESTAYCHA